MSECQPGAARTIHFGTPRKGSETLPIEEVCQDGAPSRISLPPWRMRMARQYRRVSADCHLALLWLPPDLFTSNASSKHKEQMPYVAEQPDVTKVWTDIPGANYGQRGG